MVNTHLKRLSLKEHLGSVQAVAFIRILPPGAISSATVCFSVFSKVSALTSTR